MKRLLPLLAMIALVAAACGGGDSDSGVASLGISGDEVPAISDGGAPSAVDQETAVLEFAACMRDNGVDMEDPTVDADGNIRLNFRGNAGPGEEGFDRETVRTAQEACAEYRAALSFGFEDRDNAEFQDQILEFAACMRDNGYDMADPDFSSFGPGGEGEPGDGPRGPFGAIDPEDPAFQTGLEACQDILSGFGPDGAGPRFGGPGGGEG
jgi:hypothetical protein